MLDRSWRRDTRAEFASSGARISAPAYRLVLSDENAARDDGEGCVIAC